MAGELRSIKVLWQWPETEDEEDSIVLSGVPRVGDHVARDCDGGTRAGVVEAVFWHEGGDVAIHVDIIEWPSQDSGGHDEKSS